MFSVQTSTMLEQYPNPCESRFVAPPLYCNLLHLQPRVEHDRLTDVSGPAASRRRGHWPTRRKRRDVGVLVRGRHIAGFAFMRLRHSPRSSSCLAISDVETLSPFRRPSASVSGGACRRRRNKLQRPIVMLIAVHPTHKHSSQNLVVGYFVKVAHYPELGWILADCVPVTCQLQAPIDARRKP